MIRISKNGLFFFGLSVLAILAAGASRPAGAADLFLADEPELYAAIDRLNAGGALPGFLANTRPYSLRAVRAAVEEAVKAKPADPHDVELLRFVAGYVAPRALGRIAGEAAHANRRLVPPNSDGVPVPDGWSFSPSLFLREETSPYAGAQIRARSFFGEGGDSGNRLLDASFEFGADQGSIVLGKFPAWYGPGRRGALILTSNAAPYPGIRIHNPRPIRIPGLFSFLGSGQYDLFVARMEKRALRSHSLLVGTRLAARPAPWLEIGASRVLHYGGEGSSDKFIEMWREYWKDDDRPDRSSKITGYDVTLTIPNRLQPFQLYWERAGEGTGHLLGSPIHWPSAWGNLVGIYLPKVVGISRLDLRGEYADTFSGTGKNTSWYEHPVYPHRYRGEVLGHPAGGNTIDWYFESRYFLRPNSFVSASFEQLARKNNPEVSGAFREEERHRIGAAGITGWLSATVRAEARGSMDRVTNAGGAAGAKETDYAMSLSVSYQSEALARPGAAD